MRLDDLTGHALSNTLNTLVNLYYGPSLALFHLINQLVVVAIQPPTCRGEEMQDLNIYLEKLNRLAEPAYSSLVSSLRLFAFNLTDARYLSEDKTRFDKNTKHWPDAVRKEIAASWFFKLRPVNTSVVKEPLPETRELELSKEIINKAEVLNILGQTEQLVYFMDSYIQYVLCAEFCIMEKINPAFLERIVPFQRFDDVWPVMAKLDKTLIDQLFSNFLDKPNPVRYRRLALSAIINTRENNILPALFDYLEQEEPGEIRDAIIKTLAVIRDPRFVDRLIALIFEGNFDSDSKHQLAIALSKYGDVIIEKVKPYLDSNHSNQRYLALLSLLHLEREKTKGFFAGAVKDKDQAVQELAISFFATTKYDDPGIFEEVLAALEHKDPKIRYRVVQAFNNYKWASDIEVLLKRLEFETDTDSVLWILKMVSERKDQRALPALWKLIESPDPEIRTKAIGVLGTFGAGKKGEIKNKLLSMIKDTRLDDDTRGMCIASLTTIGDKEVIRPILELANGTSSESLLVDIVLALGKLKDIQATDFLIKMLHHQDDLIREHSVTGLGKLGTAQAIEQLLLVLKGKDSQIKSKAYIALSQLGVAIPESDIEDLFKNGKVDFETIRTLGNYQGEFRDKLLYWICRNNPRAEYRYEAYSLLPQNLQQKNRISF